MTFLPYLTDRPRRRPQLRWCAAAVAALTVALPGAATAADTPIPTSATLQQDLDGLVAAGAPGAILNIRDGARSSTLHAGVSDVAKQTPMRGDEHFKIASLTKTYTATVVLQLVQEHRLRLGASVSRWLPGLVPNGANITVRQLLNHTSGIPEYESDERYLKPYLGGDFGFHWSPRGLVRLAVSHEPVFAPGKTKIASYSNTNYVLRGLIAEKVTGRSFGDVLEQRIFRPLGLRHTSYPTKPGLSSPYAHGYLVLGEPPATDVTGLSPSLSPASGAIVSTATETTRFFRALLSGRTLRPTTLRAMKTTISDGTHVDIPGQRYGQTLPGEAGARFMALITKAYCSTK